MRTDAIRLAVFVLSGLAVSLLSEGPRASTEVDPSAEVHPDARLEKTIVGANSTIAGPISLKNCVVMQDTVVPVTEDLDHALISGEMVIRC